VFFFKNKFSEIPKKLARRILPESYFLGRVACVGIEVFRLKNEGNISRTKLVNMQKVRFDLLLQWDQGEKRPTANYVKSHLRRKDIYPLIQQQERLDWFAYKKNWKYLIIDSYSELTDQKFTHKREGWSFCCHYTDINHTKKFNREFNCEGLLSVELLAKTYENFFNWFEKKYPNKKIIFIHYSTRFDKRDKFRERSKKIREILRRNAQKRPELIDLYVDDSLYEPNEHDDFPYHYSKRTYAEIVKKWRIKCG
jgi:hypothetical protein